MPPFVPGGRGRAHHPPRWLRRRGGALASFPLSADKPEPRGPETPCAIARCVNDTETTRASPFQPGQPTTLEGGRGRSSPQRALARPGASGIRLLGCHVCSPAFDEQAPHAAALSAADAAVSAGNGVGDWERRRESQPAGGDTVT
jgi:hypothetical protein